MKLSITVSGEAPTLRYQVFMEEIPRGAYEEGERDTLTKVFQRLADLLLALANDERTRV